MLNRDHPLIFLEVKNVKLMAIELNLNKPSHWFFLDSSIVPYKQLSRPNYLDMFEFQIDLLIQYTDVKLARSQAILAEAKVRTSQCR